MNTENSSDELIIKLYGKKAELSIYESRVVLHKWYWKYYHSAWYSEVKCIKYREPSRKLTGFLKVHTNKVIFEFAVCKTKRTASDDQIKAVNVQMRTALSEITSRVAAARGLPSGTNLVTYF